MTEKTRPILFSALMVRAILDGHKTMTRRVVKPPKNFPEYSLCDPFAMPPAVWWWNGKHENVGARQECPYGKVGDHLWVRESFGHNQCGNCPIHYRADEPEWKNKSLNPNARWYPSIHMPRWVSRINLEITGIRVERLNIISEEDAMAEGAHPSIVGYDLDHLKYRAGYQSLWEEINGSGSWNKNPWVWVIAFKSIEADK